MAFVNLSLLIGGLLIAIPLVLHLMMRQQPKQLVFPALRFLKERRETNRRKLRLRHWLLLLLRCLAIALLALALARPSVASAAMGSWIIVGALLLLGILAGVLAFATLIYQRGRILIGSLLALALLLTGAAAVMAQQALTRSGRVLIGDQQAPVAAALVFDTSLRMDFLHENETRLGQAKDIALWLVRQLPRDSQIAVVDSRPQPLVFAVDRAAAIDSLERLQTTPVAQSLPEVIGEAIALTLTTDLERREIYVFTDRTRQAWPDRPTEQLQEQLAKHEDIALYLIDVGVDEPRNLSLGDVNLSTEVLNKNGHLTIESELASLGMPGTRTVELHVEEPDLQRPVIRDGKVLLPESRARARKSYELESADKQRLQFDVRGFPTGVHHGTLRIVGDDGLSVDNVRHFTFTVDEAQPILVSAPADVNTFLFTEAIAPYELRSTDQARYQLETIDQSALARRDLRDYAAVCLLDPVPLPRNVWDKLESYVRQGGNLAIFLGHNATAEEFNTEAAQQLLPARLVREWRSPGGELYLAPQSFDHPMLSGFRTVATQIPWQAFPIFRHWQLDELQTGAFTVLRYGNEHPAIVERPLDAGRIVVMTTPITEPARPRGWSPWNALAGADDWPRFMLLNQLVDYLVASGGLRLNFTAGEEIVLPNDPESDPQRYQLFTPENELLDVTAQESEISLRFAQQPGTYRLKGSRGEIVARGFSVNAPAEATDLRRLETDTLDELLGEERYQLASDPQQLRRVQGQQRAGRQFYPFLIVAVALVFGLEHLLSNRFYPDDAVVT